LQTIYNRQSTIGISNQLDINTELEKPQCEYLDAMRGAEMDEAIREVEFK